MMNFGKLLGLDELKIKTELAQKVWTNMSKKIEKKSHRPLSRQSELMITDKKFRDNE